MAPVHWMEGTVYPLTILGLLVLSSIWFQMISHGVVKQQEAYRHARAKLKDDDNNDNISSSNGKDKTL